MYQFLYQSIQQSICSGRIAPNEKLPSKRSLAKHLNISVITVENAYAQLLLEGYLYSVEAKGYYVQPLETMSSRQEDAPVLKEAEIQEHEFFVDFKANCTNLSHFPAHTWARLMRNVLSSHEKELYKGMPYNGVHKLRQAIRDYLYQFRGMDVSPAQIIVGAGTEYLYSRLIQLLGNDNIFALEDPGYHKFADIAANYRMDSEYIPIDDSGLSVEKLREGNANIVHVSTSNHFPTGIIMPIKRRQELMAWALEDSGRYIIEDDYDCELRYTGRMIRPMYSVDVHQKVIYMNTFSKSLVPSIRISYMVLPEHLVHRYVETMSFYYCTVSSFEQYTLAEFISQHYFERHINRLKNYYKTHRNLLLTEFQNSSLKDMIHIREQNAGTHFLLYVNTTMSKEEISRAALEQDIHLAFLSDYCHTPIVDMDRTIVINYAGIEPKHVKEAIRRMEKIFLTAT